MTIILLADNVPDNDQSSVQSVPEQISSTIQPKISESLCSTTPIVFGSSATSVVIESSTTPTVVRSSTTPNVVESSTTPTVVETSTTPTVVKSSTTPIVVGSLAASCHWNSPRIIELIREPNQGLGISIVGGKVDMFNLTPGHFVGGIFVKNVSPGSVAARNGALKRGDRILEVDGKDLRDATHDQAVEAIRNAQNPIKMVVQSLMSLVNDRDENQF